MSLEAIRRYPLTWPAGWIRTAPGARRRAPFSSRTYSVGASAAGSLRALTVFQALGRVEAELRRLGADERDRVVSSNLQPRLDGLPRSDQAEPGDPGVAVYFRLKGQPRALACDRWTRVADNLAAIAAHIDAIRAVERYGVGTLDQAFAGYTALPANTAAAWWHVLGCASDASLAQVEAAFRTQAEVHHPDRGGSHDAMARLTEARAIARAAIRLRP